MDKETIETLAKALKKLECDKCRTKNEWIKSEAIIELKKIIKRLRDENKKLRKLKKLQFVEVECPYCQNRFKVNQYGRLFSEVYSGTRITCRAKSRSSTPRWNSLLGE